MKLKMSLLSNAYDYLNISLKYFHEADEDGNHNEFFASPDKNSKWKFAIINLIQAMELLFKEILRKEHPILIYENISNGYNSNNKTVSISHALKRMQNILDLKINNSDLRKIKNTINLRNEIMHYKFSFSSEEIKEKYALIYKLLKEFHEEYLFENLSEKISKDLLKVENNLLYFIDNSKPFRGEEINKNNLKKLKEEIAQNKNKKYYLIDGKKYKRIRYGEEPDFSEFHAKIIVKEKSTYLDNEICSDCIAKKGEFHLPGCDLEVCPKCLGQVISCDCDFEEDLKVTDYFG